MLFVLMVSRCSVNSDIASTLVLKMDVSERCLNIEKKLAAGSKKVNSTPISDLDASI